MMITMMISNSEGSGLGLVDPSHSFTVLTRMQLFVFVVVFVFAFPCNYLSLYLNANICIMTIFCIVTFNLQVQYF